MLISEVSVLVLSPFLIGLFSYCSALRDFLFYFSFFRLCRKACRTTVPQPGIESMHSAMEAWSAKPWTSREFPLRVFFFNKYILDKNLLLHMSFENISSQSITCISAQF